MANIITLSRLIGAIILIFLRPLSLPFWLVYVYCGISDMLDGYIARKYQQQSPLGSKLDSMADFIFLLVVIVIFTQHVLIPLWLWLWIGIIAVIRIWTYSIGFIKYRTFSALHTNANKLIGILLFLTPLFYVFVGINVIGITIGCVATYSACEEYFITIKSKELDNNQKAFSNK